MSIQQDASLHEDLTALRDRLERGDVEGGREVIARLSEQYPNSDEVRYLARVLARPTAVVRNGEPSRPLDRERAWLRIHTRDYPGCWIAVSGDQLLAADPDYAAVLDRVRQTSGVENAVLYFQPSRTATGDDRFYFAPL